MSKLTCAHLSMDVVQVREVLPVGKMRRRISTTSSEASC